MGKVFGNRGATTRLPVLSLVLSFRTGDLMEVIFFFFFFLGLVERIDGVAHKENQKVGGVRGTTKMLFTRRLHSDRGRQIRKGKNIAMSVV